MIFLLIFVIVIFLLHISIKERYRFWQRLDFVSVEGKFPFGNIQGVGRIRSTAQALTDLYNENKQKANCLGFYLLLKPAILAISPEMIKEILVKEFNSFHDRGMYYNKKTDPLSANLVRKLVKVTEVIYSFFYFQLTLNGDEWKNTRIKITPAFSTSKMRMMFETIDKITDTLTNVLRLDNESNYEVNITQRLAEYSTDVIGNVAFGLECNCLEDPNSEVRKYGKKIFKMSPMKILRFFFKSACPGFSHKLGLRSTDHEASDFFMNVFKETVEYREKNHIRRKDFLQILIDLRNGNEAIGLTLNELCAESFAFFGGGFETTATTISFCLYFLAQHTEIQDKLRQNILETLTHHDGHFTYDSLSEMKYLSMVVDETLRMNPPIPMAMRQCTINYKVPNSNLVIPKGVSVFVPTLAIHYDSQYYPSPEMFNPERFNDENVKNRIPYTYLPFGDGPRICIGMRFGIISTKIAVAKLILNFNVKVSSKTQIPMKFSFSSPFMTPAKDIYLNLRSLK